MRALCLAGGGAKGAYQVGALQKWMAEDGIDYEILTGISVGSINATVLTQGPLGQPKAAWQKLSDLWNTADNSKIKRNWFPFRELSALWKTSVYDSSPLQSWIQNAIDAKLVAASGRKLRISTVSLNSGESYVATEADPDIAKWVVASSAFPVMLSPIELNNQVWADGGLRSVTPINLAIEAGADEIDLILCSDPFGNSAQSVGGKAALPGLAMRVIDILTDQIARADFTMCGLKNDLSELKPEYRKVKIRMLEPSEVLGDTLDFSPDAIKKMMAIGYKDACNAK